MPVEERDQVLPGVQAGVDPAPLEKVCGSVNRTSSYEVVWVAEKKCYAPFVIVILMDRKKAFPVKK